MFCYRLDIDDGKRNQKIFTKYTIGALALAGLFFVICLALIIALAVNGGGSGGKTATIAAQRAGNI